MGQNEPMDVDDMFGRLASAIGQGHAAAPPSRIPQGTREAAVLVLFDSGHGPAVDDLALTFVEKSALLRRHAGQIAFPGGRVEPEDADMTATALREAHEETGLTPNDVTVRATMPKVSVPSGYDVTAVIAHGARTPELRVNDPGEIAAVHRIPVATLIDPAHRLTATFEEPRPYAGPAFGVPAEGARPGVFIWGMTAHLLDTIFTLAGLDQDWDRDRRVPVPQQYR